MDNKLYWSIDKLRSWDKNPRDIKPEDFARLKKQIQRLDQYKPLLVTESGEVLGGNMRLKAFKELGITEIWVSVVQPKSEAEKLEYALSDNDQAGFYIEQDLAKLVQEYGLSVDLNSYKIDIGQNLTLTDLLNNVAGFEPNIKEKEVDENIETDNKCPKCGYEW